MITTIRDSGRRHAPPATAKAPTEDRWTTIVMEELHRLIAEGDRSASGIAEELNDKFAFASPLTRSAVIGKCYRMDISLPGKSSPTTPESKAKRATDRIPVAAPVSAPGTPVDIFALPVGPTPVSGPLTAATRGHLVAAAGDYDRYQQSVLDWLDGADEEGEIAGDRPAAPLSTIPYWTGNDPVTLMDLADRACHFVTSRSARWGLTHYCGDPAPGGRFCTWHGRMSHTNNG